MICSYDVESTGLDLWHGCRPFFIGTCTEHGLCRYWEWPVAPLTRQVLVPREDLEEVDNWLLTHSIVGHNIKYDLRATELLMQDVGGVWGEWEWDAIEDTLLAAHALRNQWSHSLKVLRDVFFHVPSIKRDRLRAATSSARGICRSEEFIKKHGKWRIAEAGDPHWPGITRTPEEKREDVEGWWYFDTWLPKAICVHAPEFLPPASACNYPKLLPEENWYETRSTDKEDRPDGQRNFQKGRVTTRGDPPRRRNYGSDTRPSKRVGGASHPWQTVCKAYALEDVETTIGIWWVLKRALKDEGLFGIYRKRIELQKACFGVESNGVHLLNPKSTLERYQKEAKDYEHKAIGVVNAYRGGNGGGSIKADVLTDVSDTDTNDVAVAQDTQNTFNVRSPTQIRLFLYNELGLPVLYRTDPSKTYPKGQPSTNEKTLDRLSKVTKNRYAALFMGNLLKSRKSQKVADFVSSYHRWALDSYIHPSINVTGTRFTRQSCNAPNLQNIPAGKDNEEEGLLYGLREVFGPESDNVWITADYSNLELRIWGYLCGNKEFIRCFETGQNVHLLIARELHPELRKMTDEEAKGTTKYKKTKNFVFAVIYGSSPREADVTAGLSGAYNMVGRRFPEVRVFTERAHDQVSLRGYITTLGGYRLYIPPEEPHKAVSGIIQGTAGDVIGGAMVDCDGALPRSVKMLLQIHDELVFSVPKRNNPPDIAKAISTLMTVQGDKIGIPTPVSAKLIKDNWSEGVTI